MRPRRVRDLSVPAALFACALAGSAGAQTVPLDPLPFVLLREDAGGPGGPPAFPTPVSGFDRVDLGDDPTRYLQFGLDIRERYEHYSNAGFGLLGPPKRQDYLLSRVMADADLHLGDDFRALVQISHHDAPGKSPLEPVDQDGFDVQQAFFDVATSLSDTIRATIRIGRQEILLGSGRFVDIREGPNVRQSHDGVRGFLTFGDGGRVDAFLVRPVLVRTGNFDDEPDPHQAFGGVYATLPKLRPDRAVMADLYGFWLLTKDVRSADGPTIDRRITVGARLYGHPGAWDYDADVLGQFGSVGSAEVEAGGVAAKAGYTLGGLPVRTRLGLQADWFSGGPAGGRVVRTFNPLFPRGGYFSEPGLQTFENLIDVFPSVTVYPGESIAVQAGTDFTWRDSTRDAVYIAPGIPLPRTASVGGRYIGTNFVLQASWSATRWLSINASHVHVTAGPALTNAGGGDLDYTAVWTSLRF